MSFLRWDVLAIAFVLAIPLFAMGLRGDLSPQEVAFRLPWCLLAGWAAMTVLRWASRPSAAPPSGKPGHVAPTAPDGGTEAE